MTATGFVVCFPNCSLFLAGAVNRGYICEGAIQEERVGEGTGGDPASGWQA